MNEDRELVAVFKAEVGEQLDELELHLGRASADLVYEDLFHLAHNVKGAARMVGAPGLTEVAHVLEDLFDAMRSGRPASPETTALMREGATLLRECFDALGGGATPDASEYIRKVAEALSLGAVVSEDAETGTASRGPALTLAARGVGTPAAADADAREKPSADSVGGTTIRISVEKLDRLMGLSAEFATTVHRSESQRLAMDQILARAERLGRTVPAAKASPDYVALLAAAKDLHRAFEDDGNRGSQIADELQSAIRQLRMIRMDTVSALLGRVAHGAAEAHGREVRFDMVGGETEIDRAILERLRDPLVHLIRNAIAHGIESPSQRTTTNKPPIGRVAVRAESSGASVEIVVADDGRGVDLERVRRRAVALGVVDEREAALLTPEDTAELVFHPGLSTALSVSELAGRGFGMDIVRANVAELGGTVTLVTGATGTEVRLRAPLTLLTTRVLVATVAGQAVAVPMMNVERAIAVERGSIRMVDGRDVIVTDEGLLQVASLASVLAFPSRAWDESPALVLAEGHRRCAYLVDEVIGERELTMQSLGWNLHEVPGIAGGAVVESGEVVLVLHAHELVGGRMRGARSSASTHEPSKAADKRGGRVLLVDDSVTSRTLQKNILASAGYDVRTANDGEAALAMLREHPAEIVISDVEMPRMNGIELTTRLRASTEFARLPIILVTSLGSAAHRDRGAEAGADAYIVKGEFDQDELLRAVARLL